MTEVQGWLVLSGIYFLAAIWLWPPKYRAIVGFVCLMAAFAFLFKAALP